MNLVLTLRDFLEHLRTNSLAALCPADIAPTFRGCASESRPWQGSNRTRKSLPDDKTSNPLAWESITS